MAHKVILRTSSYVFKIVKHIGEVWSFTYFEFFGFSFFWENFRYINQGSGQKKMSEDVVENVSKSVCSAQKAYLLCISNNISGPGPFLKPVLKL